MRNTQLDGNLGSDLLESLTKGMPTDVDSILLRMQRFNIELDGLMRRLFHTSLSLQEFLAEATAVASRTLNTKRVSVWCYNPSRTEIMCVCLHDDGHQPDSHGLKLKKRDFPGYFEAIAQSRTVAADDAWTDSRTSEFLDSYLEPLNIKSMLDAHIPSASGVVGVVCCENVGASREWAMDEIGFVAQFAQLVGIAFERDERARHQEQLLKALQAAEDAGEAKASFLANMSHEIRTPMNGVLGMLELAVMNAQDAKQREFLETASSSANCLMRILDDILDYSRLEAGEFEIHSTPFDLRQTVVDVVQLFRSRADEKGLQIAINFDEQLPDLVRGDGARIRQIITNFLSNAVKFTQNGQITINVALETDHPDQFRIVVRDSGIGIEKAKLDRLFNRFSQIDDSRTREYGGTGLGLAISKQLAELMEGSIGAESEFGQGSTFWVSLPIGNTADVQSLQDRVEDFTETLDFERPLRILCAEDNLVNRMVLGSFLEKMGHKAVVVENGREAIDTFNEHDFDVILMDIQMPVMDGITATRVIRGQAEPKRSIPIIALTANAMEGDRERYLSSGMDGYIPKPVNMAELKSVLLETLETKSKT